MATLSEVFTNIADAIRSKTGKTDAMTPAEMVTEIETLGAGSGEAPDPVLQEKTVAPSTSEQEVTADSGFDGLSKVTVNAMPTVEQATPRFISVNKDGVITVSATQEAGYVEAGTKTVEGELETQEGQLIIPGTNRQFISAYKFLSGDQIIEGDENLIPPYIVSGISIFGVEGTAEALDPNISAKVYNSNEDENVIIAINGVMCLPGTTTNVMCGFYCASFTLVNMGESTVANIYFTNEYEGEEGETIVEESPARWTEDASGVIYGVMYDFPKNTTIRVEYAAET